MCTEIHPMDLVEHSIDLLPNACPAKAKLPRYTCVELNFANKIFPEMVEASIIMRMSSQWGACTKFPSKKKGSSELRVVHNYIPVNC